MKKWTKPVIRNIVSEFNPSCDCQAFGPGGNVVGTCFSNECDVEPPIITCDTPGCNCDCYFDCYTSCDCDCFDIPPGMGET